MPVFSKERIVFYLALRGASLAQSRQLLWRVSKKLLVLIWGALLPMLPIIMVFMRGRSKH